MGKDQPVLADTEVAISFQNGQFSSFGGCNDYNGAFSLSDDNPFLITIAQSLAARFGAGVGASVIAVTDEANLTAPPSDTVLVLTGGSDILTATMQAGGYDDGYAPESQQRRGGVGSGACDAIARVCCRPLSMQRSLDTPSRRWVF